MVSGLLAARPAGAIIVFGSGDPQHNTSSPAGELTGSGWQWQTDVSYCATAIGPHHAVTARHLGLGAGSIVRFAGLTFPVVAVTNAPDSDLQLVELAGHLPDFAPIYSATNEPGRTLVLHGRGTQRGNAVSAPDATGAMRGWRWGGGDGRLRWGTNVVTDTGTGTPDQGFAGEVLIATFGPGAVGDTGTLSSGDSGGGAFLRDDDGRWKLAGVNYAVEASFNTTTNGAGFFAALFDRRGFYEQDSNNVWVLDETQADQPGTVLIMTRVSQYAAWIAAQLTRPPAANWPVLQSSDRAAGPFFEHSAYTVNPAKRQISIALPTGNRFFRLDGAPVLAAPVRQGAQLIFNYQ